MAQPPSPPLAGTERDTLEAFLGHYRAVLRDKASGLTDRQLHTRLEPSTLTLGNLLHHMAVVEHWWFHQCFAGHPALEPWASAPWDEDRDWEMTVAPEVPTDVLFGRYDAAIDRSNEILRGVEDLGEESSREGRDGEHFSMRWILIHLIEEYARHCGHADLIRESIDGEVGDFRG